MANDSKKDLTAFDLPFDEWLEEQPDGSGQFRTFSEVRGQIKSMQVKQGDVWIVTFPKSGTTWMQELVWLLTHNLDYEGAKTLLKYRSPGLDAAWAHKFFRFPSVPLNELEKRASLSGGRRVIKTHLRSGVLPDKILDPSMAKIVYVARNPKDVSVSFYYFHTLYEGFRQLDIDINKFAEYFMEGKVAASPYWPHIKEFWARRNDPNVLFVKYEDMKKDLEKIVRTVATFLEEPVPSGEQMTKLLDHLSFESMKKNPALNRESGEGVLRNDDASEDNKFIRKGIIGDWKQKLSPEVIKKFDDWIKENTKGTDIQFEESQ